MAVTDYSTTPGSNTAISGIDISENCSPANVNNAIRQLMADIANGIDGSDFASTTGLQPLDATLTALAAVTTAANKLIYATGSDTFTTADLTAFARTILAAADAAAVRTLIGVEQTEAVSGTGTSGSKNLGGGFTMTWRALTFSGGSGSTSSYTFGNNHTYSSWSRSWVEGDDGANDVSIFVTSSGLSSANVKKEAGGNISGQLFSIGV